MSTFIFELIEKKEAREKENSEGEIYHQNQKKIIEEHSMLGIKSLMFKSVRSRK